MAVIDGSIVRVSHLGLIAGLIDELKIVETIDTTIPKKRGHKISHGLAVKALLLNCLGFVERRLYIMPDYFDDIATERLLGPGIEPKHLNQYLFGETLDRISDFGLTYLFNVVVLIILNLFDLVILRIHTDTTSISVTGEYDSDFNTRLIRGHSKDHRDDLKQFVIELSTDQRGIPIHMEPLSGNESDKKTFLSSILNIRGSIDLNKTVYHIADSAFYNADKLTTLGSHCYWISHVLELILEAKTLISANIMWEPCSDPRYMCSTHMNSYVGIQQKWFLYHSTELHKHQIVHDESRMEKRLEKGKNFSSFPTYERICMRRRCQISY